MSDERFEEILAELEGELDAGEREALAARLALAADPVDPDPALRGRILERIDRAALRRRAARRRAWRSAGVLVATAASAACVTYLVVAAMPDRSPPPVGEDVWADLQAELEEQDEEIAKLEHDLDEARDALSVLTAARVERLDLASPTDLAASARVYWDWDAYSCYFVAEGLPAAERGHTYALWIYTDEDEVLLAGSFAAVGGRATFFTMLPKEMGHVVRAVVTDEPAPPGEEPAGETLLAGGGEAPGGGSPTG